MLNDGKLSIPLYETKKILSANAEPWRVLLINAEPYKNFCWRILNRKGSVSQFWTIKSCLFRYTKSRRFCPRMLNHSRFSVRFRHAPNSKLLVLWYWYWFCYGFASFGIVSDMVLPVLVLVLIGFCQFWYWFWHSFDFDDIDFGFALEFWDESRSIAFEQINPWDGLVKCVTVSPYQWTFTQDYMNSYLPSI